MNGGPSVETYLSRLGQTPGDVERAIAGKTDAERSLWPDGRGWAAKKIVCHLRGVGELFQTRFHTVLAIDEPRILVFGASADDLGGRRIDGSIGHPLDPERCPEDRQYRRNDAREALAAWVAHLAAHDDNHVDQLLRALEGRP